MSGSRILRVDDEFASYIRNKKNGFENITGRKISMPQFTRVYASINKGVDVSLIRKKRIIEVKSPLHL